MDIDKLVKVTALNVFSNITLIDIAQDKVSFLLCQDSVVAKESNTYEEYFEKLKKVIHPDYLTKYFDAISLNRIKESDNAFECVKYYKLSANLSYDHYIDIVKKIDDNRILILSLKCDVKSENNHEEDDLNYLVADVIVSVEAVISNLKSDSYEVENAMAYIKELLNDLKLKNKKVLQNYTEKITNEVNKTYESLLIIDDDNLTRNVFKKVFEKDYKIIEAKNGAEAVEIIEKNIINVNQESTENIVGMFLDLKMPVMDGFGVLDYLTDKRIISRMPVIIISADDAKETKEEVYKYEIADMIEKPFNYELIKKRVNNMVRMYAKSNILNGIAQGKDTKLKSIVSSYLDAYLIDYQANYELIAKYGRIVLNKYAAVTETKIDVEMIADASKYYDVAINVVPRRYLERIKGLTDLERQKVYNYPHISNQIIASLSDNYSEVFIKYASQIATMHNERYDGLGFPLGLKNDDIPMDIYLMNIVIDYVNYMVNHQGASAEEISKLIESKSGSKYHPKAVEIFISVIGELK